ncbi:glycosyltransferase [Kineococcus rubinsiae]|uniref:glycosyltransferase n=1 Tax=Kineococcus rubinsiae TaxID=2609562 RepID=UPI00143139D9|nr:glycosyltransferase [Kineococcus rubinsiae]NIZ92774.1 glycosyltransferase [Kineococcus rubinsiae]
MTAEAAGRVPRVLVVGSGWRFTSGISYYTCRLTNAFAAVTPTSALLMRRLVPRALYPGRERVGTVVNDLQYAPGVEVLDGVDWYWGRTAPAAAAFLAEQRPDVVVLQWWTGAVLHSYLLIATLARRRGAKVVVEWHEVQDTGEARVPGVVRYVRLAMRALLRRVDAHVVHSAFDAAALQDVYGLDPATVTTIPHGPYDHVVDGDAVPTTVLLPHRRTSAEDRPTGDRPTGDVPGDPDAMAPMRLLFFGTIRPYKGLEDLVEAFSALPREVAEQFRLSIVGETWEGWTHPLDAAAASPHADLIDVVNRYVSDAEVREHFARAEALVLPYRRSSASGPLHMAMSAGLPTVVTSVGGLVEAAAEYDGALAVPPADPAALAVALRQLLSLRGHRYADPHSWSNSVDAYLGVFSGLGVPGAGEVSRAAGTPVVLDLTALNDASPQRDPRSVADAGHQDPSLSRPSV